jgi:hypothetical protein
MSNRNSLMAAQKLRQYYTGLPRRSICIRAVHHVFKSEDDTEKADDGDGWLFRHAEARL